MFATVEEAEKARAMLRRFGSLDTEIMPGGDGSVFGQVLSTGHGDPIEGWEQVADLLLERQPEGDDQRAGKLAEARACVVTAGVEYRAGHNGSALNQLIRAFDELLEALA